MEKYCPKCFKKYQHDAERCREDGSYLVSTTDRDLTGEVLDERYTVLERIGRGGMGVVYKAEQHLIKRIVALKALRRDIVQDESAVKRFLNEARAIASLDSKHTVTLHDFGVTRDGLLYYTMELLKGRPLTRIIREEAPVDHVRAAGLLLQACRSLEEAHEHNILHRDIKPDNLFVTVKKVREELKVLDFGIAKLVGDASMDTVTRTGMIIGTPQYLSPEQALGNPVVPASDLYSLAIVFYEMLAGKPPFIADTPMKTMWAHIRDPVPPLRHTNPKVQVPRSIEAFLTRALEKEPGKRYQSVPAFAEALRKAVEDHEASPETVSLPPLSTTEQGLRVRTRAWDGRQAGGILQKTVASPDEASAEAEETGTAALDVSAVGEDRRQEEEDRAFGKSATPKPTDDASLLERARAETAWAGAHVEADLHRPTVAEPVRAPEVAPPSTLAEPLLPASDQLAPGHGTLALALPGRKPLAWTAGGIGILVLVLGLVVWAPWKDVPLSELAPGTGKPVESGVAEPLGQDHAVDSALTVEVPSQDAGPELAPPTRAADTAQPSDLAGVTAAPDASDESDPPGRSSDVEGDQAAATQGAKTPRRLPETDVQSRAQPTEPVVMGGQQAEEERKAEATRKRKADEAGKAEEFRMAAEAKKAEEEKRKTEATRRTNAKSEAEKDAAARKLQAEEARHREEDRSKASQTEHLLHVARTQLRFGRYEKALDRIEKAVALGGETAETRKLHNECSAGLKARKAETLVAQARTALGRKQFDACVNAATQAVKLDAGSSEAKGLIKVCKEKKELEGMKY